MRRGFTLIEVLIASILLSLGLLTLLLSMSQSQRMMLASKRFETAQKVLLYGEMRFPVPDPDQVTDDPEKNDLLNIESTSAEEIIDDLEIEMDRKMLADFEGYTFQREVDEIDDEELKRRGGLYVLRTTIRWGGNLRGGKQDEEVVVKFWRKKQ